MATKVNTAVIENYRKENNLTVEQFCKKRNISQRTYYKLMHGHLHLRLSVVIKLLNAMNAIYNYLFEEND